MTLPRVALSVRQPWAWAIFFAGKDVENRSAHAVRMGNMKTGRICIHAAKGMTQSEYVLNVDFINRHTPSGIVCPPPDQLTRGAIIGTVEIVSIEKAYDSPWFFGPRGLILSGPMITSPIPAKGKLGFFEWRMEGDCEPPKPWMTNFKTPEKELF